MQCLAGAWSDYTFTKTEEFVGWETRNTIKQDQKRSNSFSRPGSWAHLGDKEEELEDLEEELKEL